MLRRPFLILTLTIFCTVLHAGPISRDKIPDPLEPWIEWVLQDNKDFDCPFLYNNARQHRCAWPSLLNLSLHPTSGEFSIIWQVYKESEVILPGDNKNWPQDVTDNGQKISVIRQKEKPLVMLEPGIHEISGHFEWSHLPDSLTIPEDTGLVSLTVNSEVIDFPDIKKGRIWIKKNRKGLSGDQGEQIKLEVYRHIEDEIPMLITTRITLKVSGRQREAILGSPLLPDAIPLQINSQLPARLEVDGKLRVQLRPGSWSINVAARLPGPVEQLTLPHQEDPWPGEEIWVFAARNHLRLVELEGLPSIDPRQTNLPKAWKKLPAFQATPGKTLIFKVIRRGDPEPEPNILQLSRTLWLDQSGEGYTIRDRITGRMTTGWRLETSDELQLGRVLLNNEPQFITRLNNKPGVEVRRGRINLIADSRYQRPISKLKAVGWDHDFQKVEATLNLPPGWKLFSTRGIDTVTETWIQHWSLLDLFLVLITAIAMGRLWNWRVGLLGLITLVLLWHEPEAPRQVWLHLIAAIALLRVLPEGKFRWWVTAYRNLAFLVLLLIAIPFMIDEIRTGLFPQLEKPWLSALNGSDRYRMEEETQPQVISMEADGIEREASVSSLPPSTPRKLDRKVLKTSPNDKYTGHNLSKFPQRYDTQTNVQTGPGLPSWQWHTLSLNWNGPVGQDQTIDLILLSPRINLLLNLLRIVLMIALTLLIIRSIKFFKRSSLPFIGRHASIFAMMAVLVLSIQPRDTVAEIPTPELLQELKSRLLAPPDCLPECAHFSRMAMDIRPESMQVRLEVHTSEKVAVPLPGKSGKWTPSQLAVDGEPASGLARGKDGFLWLHLSKGVHQVIMFGPLPEQDSIDLALPLRPSRVTYNSDGWELLGLQENGIPDRQLKLIRVVGNGETMPKQKLETSNLPPFVHVYRTLRLGLDWRVETRVERASPTGTAIVIQVPLLEGESLLTEGFRVKNNRVLVNMPANQSSMQWESSLRTSSEIRLKAPETLDWTEIWYADVSPIWHMDTDGIAVVHHQNPEGRWLPEWHPWPGESVTLRIARPEGIEGQTLTIDKSQLTITPGQRATDTNLKITLRSSQGDQHTVMLPEQARLQTVIINGHAQPIRQDGESGREVTLPIHPGKQLVEMNWRQPEGIQALYRSPSINLGTASVNHMITLYPGKDRWILFTGGPQWGPAVLFWGELIVIILLSLVLGRVRLTPLKTWQWFLLGIGLSQAPLFSAFIVVAWLLAVGARGKLDPATDKTRFNFIQIGLVILSLIALSALFEAIKQGLLGSPDMQVSGNNSTTFALNWYQDRVSSIPPQAWIFSVPLFVYRVLMLLWSLWLAFALLQWLRWAWECFSKGDIWKSFEIRLGRYSKKSDQAKSGVKES